jgi:hypothetical protein
MGMLAKTAMSFAYQGKQTSIFCFRLQQTNRGLPFSIYRKQT